MSQGTGAVPDSITPIKEITLKGQNSQSTETGG